MRSKVKKVKGKKSKVTFYEDENFTLVKDGKNLIVYKKGVCGPTDVKENLFLEDEELEVWSYGDIIRKAKPKGECLEVKVRGKRDYRIVVHKESGKVVTHTVKGI